MRSGRPPSVGASAQKLQAVIHVPARSRCHLHLRPQQPALHQSIVIRSIAASTSASASGSVPSDGQHEVRQFRIPRIKLLPGRGSWQLVADTWGLVYANLWAVVFIFALKDASAFVLHRFAHRLTNHLAETVFGLPISSMGNPWWIMVDANFVQGHISYQVLVGAFFLLCLPLNILLNTAAVSTAAVVCTAVTPSAKPYAVPAATYSSQGRGKVGVAECRSTSSLDAGQCEAEWEEFDAANESNGDMTGVSNAAAAAACGQVGFRGFGSVSFRQQTAVGVHAVQSEESSVPAQQKDSAATDITTGESQNGDAKLKQQQQQQQQKQQPPNPPAAAPVLPWLAPSQQRPKLPRPPSIKVSMAMVQNAWSKQVAGRLRQLWIVDLLFNVWALPLQALCLAVLPVFWAFPKLLEIQLALPAAVLAGVKGKDALEKSKDLMKGFRNSYAWPFVWLIVLGRAVELLKEFVLIAMPARWWTDVVEVPLAATAVFAVVRLLLMRVQDMVPLAAYLHLQRKRRLAAAAAAM